MRIEKRITLGVILLVGSMLLASSIYGGISGKISGMIIEAKTGEPVVGATVRVVGTNYATQTDIDGEYFIINVPSGKYNLAVSTVGFETFIKKEVRVLVDLTTPVDFELVEKTVELNQQVEVYAETPVIQKDLTSSKVIYTADRLRTLPNIVTIQSVLTNYPGVVVDRDNNLHIRGGRSGEVSYYFDGFSVQDPFVNNTGIRIIPNALEELTLTSGGYNAEYGEALSGVVSAVTREGGSEYHGSVRMYEGITHSYDIYNGDWSDLKMVGNRSGSVMLNGPIPFLKAGTDNFSLAGEYLHDPTSLPHNGIVSYTGTSKLSMQPHHKMRVIANGTYYRSEGEIYEHRDVNGRSYDYNLDGLPFFRKESYLFGLSSNYHINENFIFSTRFNHFYTYTKSAPEHLFDLYWNQWPGYSEDAEGNYNGTIHLDNYGNNPDYSEASQLVGFTTGDDFNPTYRMRESSYNALHTSFVNQVDKNNQIKAGFEYRKYNVKWDFKQFFNSNPYGELYESNPVYFSLFAQNKMEYDYFIINLGLRYDFRTDDISYNATPNDTIALYEKAESTSKLSPRLGVSFPITEKSVMHFNYGVYYQVPRFTYMYTNLQGDISSGYPLLGNPNLEPERTVSYEIGLDHLIQDWLRLDITAYQKNITDLVSTRSFFEVAGNAVTTFVNEDYGSSKGVDLHLEILPSNGLFSGSVSYGYMIAQGIASTATEPYYTYLTSVNDAEAPRTEFPLDFDQRHTVTAVVDFRAPKDWNESLLGISIPGDWGLGFVGYYGSGLPYTATDQDGNRLGERNEGRLPAQYTVDMKFNKDFRLRGSDYLLSFFVEVDNLFNKQNIINVYSLTGRADTDGFISSGGLAVSQDEINTYDRLYDFDPQNFSAPRTIRTGIELNF